MKKILRNKLLLGVVVAAGLASCNYNEDDDDTLNTRLDKPVVTLSATSFSVVEGESASITLTADKAVAVPMVFKLELLPGSTGTFREFTVEGGEITDEPTDGSGVLGYHITVPAYTTEYTFDITPILDLDVESSETFNLRIYGSSSAAGRIADDNENFNIEVANGTSNDFRAELDWSGTYADAYGVLHPGTYIGADGLEHDYCAFDFDMEILDNTFTPVYYDWNNCPAIATLPGVGNPEGEAPDGEYYIVAAFYTNAIAAAAVPQGGDLIYPVKLAMGKPGVFVHKADLSTSYSYAQGGYADGNDSAYKPVGILTKTGATYVLTDFDDPSIILAQGRMADIRNFKRNK